MKKHWSILFAGALVATALTVSPAPAAPGVPAEPNVVDPKGDANYLNDQGLAGTGLTGTAVVPAEGDRGTPADGGAVSDILAAWFSADADNVYAHIQTEAPGPSTAALFYRVTVDPGVGKSCLWFQASAPGAGNAGTPGASIRAVAGCEPVGTSTEGAEFLQEEGPDGTGIHTIKIPRALSSFLADGTTLSSPQVQSRHNVNSGNPTVGGAVAPQIDNTKPGLDYVISSKPTETPPPPAVEEPPGKNDPPGQGNQNCAKIKDKKKKKACKKNSGKGPKTPPGKGCAAYAPGEMGAEAETTVVTEKATEEEPIVIDVPIGRGLSNFSTTHSAAPNLASAVKHNVQLDVAGQEGGLFVKLESPVTDDPDLYAYWDNGKEAASAGGFNQALFAGPVPVININGTGKGGHSGFGFEQLDGIRTADCGGYTLDLVNWLGQGGTYTLKLWVGEIQNDPAPRE